MSLAFIPAGAARPIAALALAAAAAAPALASEVGRFEQQDLVITINDTKDWCRGEALSALWVQPRMQVRGCYLERDGVLLILWEDGDRHMVKREVFGGKGDNAAPSASSPNSI